MRVLIAGSRSIGSAAAVDRALAHAIKLGLDITEVVSGGALGVDRLGVMWARERGIPMRLHEPDWHGLGKRAGLIRNQEMVKTSDAVVALHDGVSKGTAYTLRIAWAAGLPVYLYDAEGAPMTGAPQFLRLPAIGQEVEVGYPRLLTEGGEPRPLQVQDRVSDNGDGTYTHTLEFAWPRLVRDEEPR